MNSSIDAWLKNAEREKQEMHERWKMQEKNYVLKIDERKGQHLDAWDLQMIREARERHRRREEWMEREKEREKVARELSGWARVVSSRRKV